MWYQFLKCGITMDGDLNPEMKVKGSNPHSYNL